MEKTGKPVQFNGNNVGQKTIVELQGVPALKGSSAGTAPGAGSAVAGVTDPPSTASPRRKPPSASTPPALVSQEKPGLPAATPVPSQQASASIVPPISVMPLLQMGAAHGLGGPRGNLGDVSGPPSKSPPGPPSAQHHVGPGSGTHGKSRRPNALEVIDPKTGACMDICASGGSWTIPRSPQPSSVQGNLDVAAEFAALVAMAASYDSGILPAGRRPQSRELPHSGNTGQSLDVVADIAARVAKAASEKMSPPPQQGQVSSTPLQVQPAQVRRPPPHLPSDTQPNTGQSLDVVADSAARVAKAVSKKTSPPPQQGQVSSTPLQVQPAQLRRPLPHLPSDTQPEKEKGKEKGEKEKQEREEEAQGEKNKEQDLIAVPKKVKLKLLAAALQEKKGDEIVKNIPPDPVLPIPEQGTDVGFRHVSAGAPANFPPGGPAGPQQGDQGGMGPGGGPPQLGSGGGRVAPPQQASVGPPQQGGAPPVGDPGPGGPSGPPQLPGPTSTLPGHAGPPDLGKGPHLQPQPVPQAGQLSSFQVQNATRQNQSQPTYFPNARAPATRMTNRGPPVVSMAANVPGQQMFPQHMQPMQMQAVYPSVGISPLGVGQNAMYLSTGQMPLFPPQTRHQKPANSAATAATYYPQHGPHILMQTPFAGYSPAQAGQHGPHYYYQQLSTRPAPAGAGPPTAGPSAQQVVGAPGPTGAPQEEKEKEKEKGEKEKQEREQKAEGEKNKEQDLIAVPNKVNAKLRSVALEEKKGDEIVENIPPKPVLPVPKQMYREDQWSPFNPDGKKKYERDFLMKLRDTPEAKKKPEIRLDVLKFVLKDKVTRLTYFPNARPPSTRMMNRGPPVVSVVANMPGEQMFPRHEKEKENEKGEKEKQEREEDAEGEKNKEQDSIAVPNKVNAKLPAAALKEKKGDEIVQNIPPEPVLPVPKQMYREDQWSPFNPDGKKKYERDFLMKLRDTPEAKKKPLIRPDVLNFVLKDKVTRLTYFPNARVPPTRMTNRGPPVVSVAVNMPGQQIFPRHEKEKEKEKGEKEKQERDQKAEGEKNKEQDLIAAPNKVNTKLPAAALEEKKGDEIVENIPPKPVLPVPKQMYREDQWSPFNPDGKKKYERDFLMKLRDTPEAKKKPEIRPDVLRFVLKDKVNRFPPQTRHQNPANSAATAATHYPQHGPHILMQMPFAGYSPAHIGQHGPHYYYQQLTTRPVPAGAGPPTAGPGARQVVGVPGPTGTPHASDLTNVLLHGSEQCAGRARGVESDSDSDSDRSSAFFQMSDTFADLQDIENKKSGIGTISRPYGKRPPPSNVEHGKTVNTLAAEKEERQAQTVSSGTPSQSTKHKGSSAKQTPAISSSQSCDDLAAVAQPVASGSSAISDRDTRENLPHLIPDKVTKKIQLILEKLVNNYFQSILLEQSASVRNRIGKLMAHLVKEGILTTEQFLEGFREIAEVADDLATDVPKVWLYLAEILVPMLTMEVLPFSDLETATTGMHKLLIEILRLLVQKKNLESTSGPAGEVLPLTPEVIHTELLRMLRPGQGAPATTDKVVQWISANVGDRARTPEFIRILTTAVCESAYRASSSEKFDEPSFSKHATLLQRYIDTNEELELHCLYAVQGLNHRLEQPSGLLCSLFQALWDFGCVANETFLKWEQSKDPAFLQGKGIALESLTAFFTALREADDDSSEDCASGQ